MLTDRRWAELLHTRATDPDAVPRAYAARHRRENLLSGKGTFSIWPFRT